LRTIFVFTFVLLLGCASRGQAELQKAGAEATAASVYVGSSNCRECHDHFYQLWSTSFHGLAMQPFTPELTRTKLQELISPITIGDAQYRTDLAHARIVEWAKGLEKSYPIAHAMGGKNVFFFLTPLERGRLQVLPLAYDVRRKEWYDTAGSAVRHFGGMTDAPLDWTDVAFTFNSSCFNCHVSQLSNNYDLGKDTYHTTWSEPGINCETCHGPGAEHIRAARATPKGKELGHPKLITTGAMTLDQRNALCSSCHAKIYPLTTIVAPGERFFDHFGLIALENPDFYPDGRDLGENFTETSWRLSACAASGQLECIHCHTSSGRNRFVGEKANNACLPCHASQVQHAAEHSHHRRDDLGSKCVSCHMPQTEFARMRRTDHSFRPPMPAASRQFGSPNACTICHAEKDAAWADAAVRQWHTNDYQQATLERASLIAAARKHDWSTLSAMVQSLEGKQRQEIWAASLLALLRFCDDERKWPALTRCLADSSPLVRAAAVDACSDRLTPDCIKLIAAASADSYRLVRTRAAAALAQAPADAIPPAYRKPLETATEEYKTYLLARPDDSASHYNLGNYYLDKGSFPQAIDAFETAIKLQPKSVLPLVNVAMAYAASGKSEQAERSLRRALSIDPTNAVANLNLGMLLAEIGRPAQAEQHFRTSFVSEKTAAAAYNLGVLLAKEKPDEALTWCQRAAELRPDQPKYSYTWAYYLIQNNRAAQAIPVLQKALANRSADVDCYALLGQLYEHQQKTSAAAETYRLGAGNERFSTEIRDQFAARAKALEQAGKSR
jgi:tetratricopeptide (TPR) repeat protein